MGVFAALAGDGVRRHRAGLAALAATVGLGLGAGLVSIEAADRTASAYPEYLRRAEVAELVVNPVLATEQAEAIFRSTPGVVEVRSDSLLNASSPDGAGSEAEADLQLAQIRMSPDGRYLDQDRPVVQEGRMLRSGNEAFLSREAAGELGVEVGDEFPLSFSAPTFPGAPEEPVEPIGTVRVRVVGIGAFSDEILPDELLPRARILVTPDVGEPFDCTPSMPGADDRRSIGELTRALFPPDCALSYRYYSLRVEGGDEGAQAVADALARRFRQEAEQLPRVMRANDFGYSVIPSFAADDARRLRESLAPAVTALRAFGIAAGLASVGAGFLLAVRHLRRREPELGTWRSLGLATGGRAVAVAGPVSGAAIVGVAGALVLAWAASPVGPVASARTVVPDPSRGLAAPTLLAALLALVLLAAGVALAARQSSLTVARGTEARNRTRRGRPLLAGAPFVSLGIGAAIRNRGAGAVLAGAVVAVTAVAATVVFEAGLVGFLDEPERFGWPYDAAALINAGYGQGDVDAVTASMDRPEVERWGIAALSGGLTLNGETLPFIAEWDGFDRFDTDLTMIAGRPPHGDGEVAVGALTAEDLDLEIGDDVTVTMPYGERQARVSGLVVLPSLGPLESDRTSLGTGVLLPAPLFEAVLGQAEVASGQSGEDLADGLAAFVAVDLRAGVDAGQFLAGLGDEPLAWDPYGARPRFYTDPVRPAAVVDIAAIRQVPMLLAATLATAMAISVVAGIAAGTRSRRRELTLLRAFGGTRRQRRASVRAHALAVVTVALVVGLPLGVVIGRVSFGRFAESLGAAPDATVPLLLLGAVAAGAIALALGAAALSAHRLPWPTPSEGDDRGERAAWSS